MSIVDLYKKEFQVCFFDEDINRSEEIVEHLKKKDFEVEFYSSRGLFLESLQKDLPHVFVLYYQPLNVKFRELLKKVREASDEVQVVLLASKDFWPGVQKLIDTGLVNDFWSWPAADEREVEIRLNQIIEKYIYRFVAEQKNTETKNILDKIESYKQQVESERSDAENSEKVEPIALKKIRYSTESEMVEEFIGQLKDQFPKSEFIYFKNYPSKNQLLVTRTSFSGENYFRGQFIPFSEPRFEDEPVAELNRVRESIEQTFSCEDFALQTITFGGQFFAVVMAVSFEDHEYLKKATQYFALAMRNFSLENLDKGVEVDKDPEVGLKKSQLPFSLSTEVSRARRLKLPVSVIVTHIEYIGESPKDFSKSFELIKSYLRPYDILCQIENEKLVLVLPHCSYEDAAIKAETIRRQLVALGLRSLNAPLRLCFGVSEYPSLSADSDQLLEDAKKACAQVLVSGKNKVCLFTAEEQFEPEFKPQRTL